ncbi:MAG: hypothetical protein ACFFBP_06590 [Promethearchaeota archaeon]
MLKIKKINEKWAKVIIFGIFIVIVIFTAKVDWAAMNSTVGMVFRFGWLISLSSLGIIFPIIMIHLAGNEFKERRESEKKLFLASLIIYAIANGIPIIFYVILEQPPGFFLFLQLALFGLIPAFVPQPKKDKMRYLILIILFAIIVVPLTILVNITIDELWMNPAMDNTIYYLFFWGLMMTFVFLFIAIGWKFGGGTPRESWNIFIAGTLVQYSTLEDFFYFLLNGQPLPGTWPWMDNFVINLQALFGRVPTDLDLLIFCIIINLIAIFVLLDGHGYIWNKIKQRKKNI